MGEKHNDAERTHALAVVVALAALGVSVGVNVTELMAADPAAMQSDQGKIGFESVKGNSLPPQRDSLQQKFDTTQQKFSPGTQQKLPSRQDKDRVMPGVKPMDPPR